MSGTAAGPLSTGVLHLRMLASSCIVSIHHFHIDCVVVGILLLPIFLSDLTFGAIVASASFVSIISILTLLGSFIREQQLAQIIRQTRELRLIDARHRNHLEKLVVERTSELATANEKLQWEINERSRAEEALQKRNFVLETLNAFSREITTTLEVKSILKIVARSTVQILLSLT